MSKLFKALTEMLEGSGRFAQEKASDPENRKKSEFKKLIQQEWSPNKRTCKYKHIKNLHDSDTELMNDKEASPRLY